MEIEGKIAKILNTRELVINRGTEHGVGPGMEFAVLEKYLSIVDPDTQQPLGELEREKVRVRVFETHPKFSLAQTYETYQEINPEAAQSALAAALSPYVTKVKRLNTQMNPVDQVGIANVQVGDVVKEVSIPGAKNRN